MSKASEVFMAVIFILVPSAVCFALNFFSSPSTPVVDPASYTSICDYAEALSTTLCSESTSIFNYSDKLSLSLIQDAHAELSCPSSKPSLPCHLDSYADSLSSTILSSALKKVSP